MTDHRTPAESQAAPYIPLPTALARPRETAGGVFDGMAALYDRARPGYPRQAVEELLQLSRLNRASSIVEVGCGTGQLTKDLAPTGARIDAVEPGAALAALARANLAGHPNVQVITSTFEDFEAERDSYDAVVSATAFHWVDPEVAYVKAAELLRRGGRLVLVNNTHTAGGNHYDEPFAGHMRDLHRRLVPDFGDWFFPAADEIRQRAVMEGDIATRWARVERKLAESPDLSALFDEPTVRTYPWLATYDRDSYVDMLASQSSYGLLDSARRAELLAGIGRLVDEHLEGVVTKQYVAVLAVARRS